MDVDDEDEGVDGGKREGEVESPSPASKVKRGGERGDNVASRGAAERKTKKQEKKKEENSDNEEEEEEEAAVVVMSEFAEGDDTAAGKGVGVGFGAPAPAPAPAPVPAPIPAPTLAASKDSASLASRRAKVTLEGMENEEDDEDGVGNDLRAAVKKPRVNRGGAKARGGSGGGASSKGKGKEGGKR
eukprot:evm.model.NODE_16776_length_8968_cov_27.233498.1